MKYQGPRPTADTTNRVSTLLKRLFMGVFGLFVLGVGLYGIIETITLGIWGEGLVGMVVSFGWGVIIVSMGLLFIIAGLFFMLGIFTVEA